MLLKIHPDTPSERQVRRVAEALRNGAVIIYHTDTVYGMGCDINSAKAIDRIAKIKGVKAEKANFSFIFYDLSQLADYTVQVDTPVYKILKKNLPGPFTFVLNANNKIPKIFKHKKKTVGIRIPDNNIIREIASELGNPIMTTSVYDEDEVIEYTTDPELIYDNYKDLVDIVVDGGYGNNVASAVVDCTGSEVEIIRQGQKAPEL